MPRCCGRLVGRSEKHSQIEALGANLVDEQGYYSPAEEFRAFTTFCGQNSNKFWESNDGTYSHELGREEQIPVHPWAESSPIWEMPPEYQE